MIRGLFSVRIELDRVLQSDNYEQLIFENLERCKRLVGLKFSIIFWNKKLSKEIVKDFVSRDKDRLFNLGVEITNKPGSVWFLIKSSPDEKSTARYRYEGDILKGIVEYLGIIKHMQRRDGE